jgi:hypothetical protein
LCNIIHSSSSMQQLWQMADAAAILQEDRHAQATGMFDF